MNAIYPAKFIYEDTGGYSVLFPDLKGCATFGDNPEHALSMAREAMGLYLAALEEHNHSAPPASSIAVLEATAQPGEQVVRVMVDLNDYRRNKAKTLTA